MIKFKSSYGRLKPIGEGRNTSYDKEVVKRLDELESLPENEKKQVLSYMDLVIRDYKTKKAYAHQKKPGNF